MIEGSGSGKTNLLLILIEIQLDIDKIYLYANDPYELKYQYLINKREGVGINHFNNPKAFIEYSNGIHNKKLNLIVTELFIAGRKLNTSLVFITQSYFKVPKDVRLNTSQFFIEKIPNKRELQQIAISHSSDINTKGFANIYRKYAGEPYSFLVIDTMLASNNPLRFRKNLFNIKYKFLECNSII